MISSDAELVGPSAAPTSSLAAVLVGNCLQRRVIANNLHAYQVELLKRGRQHCGGVPVGRVAGCTEEIDAKGEDAALAELVEAGTLSPLWWENDSEWAVHTAAFAAAGRRYVAATPFLVDSETGLVSRWSWTNRIQPGWSSAGRSRTCVAGPNS